MLGRMAQRVKHRRLKADVEASSVVLSQIDLQHLDAIAGNGVVEIAGEIFQRSFDWNDLCGFENCIRGLIGQGVQTDKSAGVGDLSCACELDIDVLRRGRRVDKLKVELAFLRVTRRRVEETGARAC